jgi:hypothetical protein
MGRLPVLLVLPFVFSVFLTANAQAPTTLQLGNPIERAIAQAQVHEFTIDLEENTLVQFVVEQKGIDIVVRVRSPAGKSLGEFDTPNGDDGPEHVSFVGITAGVYRITVAPLTPNYPVSGHYEIKILEMRKATEQEIKTSKNQEAVKAKGLALLNELEEPVQQIRSPQNRIRTQLQIAQMLWEADEKRALKYVSDAITGLKELLATADVSNPRYASQYQMWSQLRYEIIHMLGPRDPDAALDIIRSTAVVNPYGDPREVTQQNAELELWIADQIVAKDPDRTLQVARRTLKSRYSPGLVGTISQLRMKNAELAAQLASEIAEKLINEKLLKNNEAASLAIGLLRFGRPPRRRSSPAPQLDGAAAPVSVLGDDQYRSLLQKVLDEALSFSQPPSQAYSPERDAAWNMLNALQSLGVDLEAMTNGSSAAVEKKLTEMNRTNQYGGFPPEYQNVLATSPVDAALEAIEKAPQEQREQLYLQLANREANNGDLARAKQIISERIKNPYQRSNSLMNLEQQEIYRALSKGKAEDALRTVSVLRTPRERAMQLAQIAGQLGLGQKRATAISLLEQARGLLAPSVEAQDQDQMRALFEIARAFGKYDPKRSFEILDPLIDQLNELCTAARTMEGFGPEYYEEEELNLQNGSSVAGAATQLANVMGTLATVNFERARAASDRLRLPEVRLRAYLEIAQQTIQGQQR